MSKNKGAVLVPQSQLTDDELEQVAGGLLPAVITSQPILIGLDKPGFPGGLPTFTRAPMRGDGCGTDDSGAMGCPG